MPLTKTFIKSRGVCKVTFELPAFVNPEDKEVRILGDFNNWNWSEAPTLKKGKKVYKARLELDPGSDYEYRYLLDGKEWMNDHNADAYIPSPYAYVDNCVVRLKEIKEEPKPEVSFIKIEGIGPKISKLLYEAGYTSYEQLAKAKKTDLKSILALAGKRYQIHDPGTWPKQAKLIARGKVKQLKELQAELKGGR